ncbi:spore coat protein, partial [Bacillus sp. D-CC]
MENVLCCDQIKCLVGETVKVNLRGPESRAHQLD